MRIMLLLSNVFREAAHTSLLNFSLINLVLQFTRAVKQSFSELFLSDEDMNDVHDFEEDCMDDLQRSKEYEKFISTEERIHRTSDKYVLVARVIQARKLFLGKNK